MDKKLQEYLDRFGEGFPLYPLATGRTEDEIITLIDDCIKKGKNVYELGLVKEDEDIFY